MFLHGVLWRKKLRKSGESTGKGVELTVFVRVKPAEPNERLTQTTHVQKNGRLSYVDDVAGLQHGEAFADGVYGSEAAPGNL